MAVDKKVVTNQGAIDAANQKNAAALAKSQAAQAKIETLTPQKYKQFLIRSLPNMTASIRN